MVSVRYMGTKRSLGPLVRHAIEKCDSQGRVADVFSGMGAIASELSSVRSVVLSDILTFPTVFARAHCLQGTKKTPKSILKDIYPLFQEHRATLRREFADRLKREASSIDGSRSDLFRWMDEAPHVGNSSSYRRMANFSRATENHKRYRLTALYFSAGYFGTGQAIDIDALRFAIDSLNISRRTAAPLLAVWLSTASRVINSPGHSAQFLKPNSDSAFRRIQRQMTQSVWEVFSLQAHAFAQWGSNNWRNANTVLQGDAFDIIQKRLPDDVGIVYADPPYTKDHYSRYYHVFETLLLYDYPQSHGIGRYREDRYASPFSMKATVVDAFERLFEGVRALGLPLVLSYPSDGLLHDVGVDVEAFVRGHFHSVSIDSSSIDHSTMGGSKGPAKKPTIENIIICK